MMAYLDHAATTPLRAEAFAAMEPWMKDVFGNPSGAHSVARAARAAVDDARDIVASCLGFDAAEIVFTGGGTEADNLAVLGTLAGRPGPIVTTTIEHHAVLHAAAASGCEVRLVGVGSDGVVDLGALGEALTRDVALVSVMLANNEVGTVQPLDRVAALTRRKAPNAALHTDAVQAVPWLDVASRARQVDLVSVSAHKFGGPQGVGVLGVRDRGLGMSLRPVIHGGGQERDRRSGTHNVAGIVGLAAALCATVSSREVVSTRVAALRDRLTRQLIDAVPDAVETAAGSPKIPGNCHLLFEGVESETLVLLLDDAGVCASAGSACSSGATEPSHVLAAMGLSASQSMGALRLSLGATTTAQDIDLALKVIPDAVARLRGE